MTSSKLSKCGNAELLSIPVDHVQYTKDRAAQIYGEAFRRGVEYIKSSKIQGDVVEFGTYRGYTAYVLALLMRELDYSGRLCLFDSFEGLPKSESLVDQRSYEISVNQVWKPGAMSLPKGYEATLQKSLGEILNPESVFIVKGFFQESLPGKLSKNQVSFIHLDCDLYSSSYFVLEQLVKEERIMDGCLLYMDDYNCNRASPQMGQRRALREIFGPHSNFEYSDFLSYGWHGRAFFLHKKEKDFPRTPYCFVQK